LQGEANQPGLDNPPERGRIGLTIKHERDYIDVNEESVSAKTKANTLPTGKTVIPLKDQRERAIKESQSV